MPYLLFRIECIFSIGFVRALPWELISDMSCELRTSPVRKTVIYHDIVYMYGIIILSWISWIFEMCTPTETQYAPMNHQMRFVKCLPLVSLHMLCFSIQVYRSWHIRVLLCSENIWDLNRGPLDGTTTEICGTMTLGIRLFGHVIKNYHWKIEAIKAVKFTVHISQFLSPTMGSFKNYHQSLWQIFVYKLGMIQRLFDNKLGLCCCGLHFFLNIFFRIGDFPQPTSLEQGSLCDAAGSNPGG
jgi:hypothetical protein